MSATVRRNATLVYFSIGQFLSQNTSKKTWGTGVIDRMSEHLAVDLLKSAIKRKEFHHRGSMPSNFALTTSSSVQARKAVTMFKDSYLLDFINLCKSAKREYVEYVIQDYNRPMGVATYTTSNDMPAKLRKALPSSRALTHLLSSGEAGRE